MSSESTLPPSDAPHRGEDKPLLGTTTAAADESGSGKSSKLFENPPLDVAHHVIPTAHSNDVGEFVQWKDFFDVEKGWMKFWSPTLTFNQITSRERDDTLFCFDAFRCFAFLWVSNSHIQEGMVLYFGTTFSDWIDSTTSYAIYSTSSGGVVVFFVVSGFLNLMVAMSIARKFKDKEYYSWKSAKTFLFRRFMHLGPNLFITVLIALLVGCSSHLESLSDEFCAPCKSYWWMDYIFLGNFSSMIFGTACFNSTWTVSAQMQLYVLGLVINVIYFRHPAFAFAGALILSVISIIIRTKLTLLYGDSPDSFSSYVYTTSYCRIDSYMIGMMLWMIYEQILKPIHTKSYIPKHLRAQYLPANRNASLPTTTVNSAYGTSSTSSSVDPTLVDRRDESNSNETTNLIKPQEKDIFTYMWHEVRDQTITWYKELITNFHLFHTYATYPHIISLYVLYPIMGYCMYLGVHYALTTETDEYLWSYWPVFSGMDQSSTTFGSIRSSYALTSVALGTMGLLFFALEKVLLWPWSWVCRWWVWYPIGMLSYTGYLLSILTAYLFFALKAEVEGGQDWEVSTNTEGWWKYTVYFWVVLFINLIGAAMLSFAVERPLMNLSKAIDV